MTISTQNMGGAGKELQFTRKARPRSEFGPFKVIKKEPFTNQELAQIDELIKKNLNELFEPL